jgi:hypothetical protein
MLDQRGCGANHRERLLIINVKPAGGDVPGAQRGKAR